MATISECGHDVNQANFKIIIERVSEFGVDYNPSRADLSVANMTLKSEAVGVLHYDYIKCLAATKNPINEREILFGRLLKIVVRARNAFDCTLASALSRKDVRGYVNKITGRNARMKRLANGDPDPKHVSRSNRAM